MERLIQLTLSQPRVEIDTETFKGKDTPLSISSQEFTGSASARTAQSAQPADTPPVKAAAEIRQTIAHTREQLAGTAEVLAHKVKLPARVKDRVQETRETVQAKVKEVKQQLHKGTETLQDKADEMTLQAKSLNNQAVGKLPPPVAGRIGGLVKTARQRPVLPAAAVLGGVVLLLRRLLRRNR
jgi:seryl-tRNA synthetase